MPVPFQSRRGGDKLDPALERRLRAMEDNLHQNFGASERDLDTNALPNETGGGAAETVVISGSSGGGGGGGGSGITTLSGDVTGPATANIVERVRNQIFTAGTAVNQVPVFDGTNTWTPTVLTRTTLTLLGAWTHPSAATLTGVDAEIVNAFAADTLLANVMPVAGELVALAVKLSGDVGGVGQDVIVTVYLNGVATALTATVTGGAGVETEAVATVAPIAFVAGDDLTVKVKANGVPAAVLVAVQPFGRFSV